MAEDLLEELLAGQAQETTTEEQSASPETAAENEPETEKKPEEEAPKPPKEKREFLLPVLTFLLIVLGLFEAGFWGYYGFASYRNSLARERYEQQQKALAEERASQGITGGSSYGPNLKVENGSVTWEREKWYYPKSGSTLTSIRTQPKSQDGEKRMSRLSVSIIPYELADMGEDDPQPSEEEPADEEAGSETAPVSA